MSCFSSARARRSQEPVPGLRAGRFFMRAKRPLRPAVWFLPRLLPRGNLSQAFPFHGARSVFRRIPLFLYRAHTSQPRAGACPKRRLLPVMRNIPGAYPSPCFCSEHSLPYTQNILRGAPFRLCAAFIRVWKSNRAQEPTQSDAFPRHAKRPPVRMRICHKAIQENLTDSRSQFRSNSGLLVKTLL